MYSNKLTLRKIPRRPSGGSLGITYSMKYNTKSPEETLKIGLDIATDLKGGDIVLLYGELGAGKTTLTKGIASYFGIDDIVSPTFTLMQSYQISDNRYRITNLVHIDTYRLEDEKDLIEIGAEDYLGDENTICIIEWPEKIEGLLKKYTIKKVIINHTADGDKEIEVIYPTNIKPLENGHSKTLDMCKELLGKEIEIKIDTPAGTKKHGQIYPINYGFVPEVLAPDGEELDAYFLDSKKPLKTAKGKVIAIVHRLEDDDDKLVVANKDYSEDEIENKVRFMEQFFKHEIIKL